METDSLSYRETPWQTEFMELKRGEKKNTQENSLIIVTDKRTLHSTIPSACLSSYGAVQRFTSHSLPSFFFFFQAVKTERADDLWPAIAENVERRVSHRGTGRVDAVLFSGSELLRLAGWPCWQDGRLIVRLADDGAETWFKRNNSHVCFRK